jgi:lysozyme
MTHELAIELIKHYEGIHDGDLRVIGLQPKRCPAGWYTIGYGRIIIDPVTNKPVSDKKRAYELWPTITMEEALQFLAEDLATFSAIVRRYVRVSLIETQIGALTSLAYNIGQGKFIASDALRLINKNKFEEGVDAFMNWKSVRKDGKLVPMPGLIARRKSEQHLFKNGVFKPFN